MDIGKYPEPPSAHANFLLTKTFGSLDGLRALAILAVVWHHYGKGIPGLAITTRGFLGVDLFFVISGFLIVTLLLRERGRGGSIWLKGFYVRRLLRIFPPYYLMLSIVFATALLKPGNNSIAIKHDFPFAALYLSNLVPMNSLLAITWSLSVEEQFYLVVPTLEKYARRLLPFLLPAAYILVALPAFGLFLDLSLPHFFRETTFGPILLGAMMAHVLDNPQGFSNLFRLLSWRLTPVLALTLMILLPSYAKDDLSGWPRMTIHWTMLVLVASCVIKEGNILRPILTLWPLRRIGIVSYGIYLYHLIVGYFVLKALEIMTVRWDFAPFLLTALGTWALAECSYYYIESPFLAAKARFIPRKTGTEFETQGSL